MVHAVLWLMAARLGEAHVQHPQTFLELLYARSHRRYACAHHPLVPCFKCTLDSPSTTAG